MKNPIIIFLSILLLIPLILVADDMSVESFKRLDGDMDARMYHPEKDPTGRTCAIIKVVNPNEGFVFDTGSVSVVKTRQETGEIWVYVQPGVKKLTIKHPNLGVMRDYYFPMSIEEATVYELRLTTGTVHTYIEQKATSAYLVVNSVPEGADVYIDGEWEGQTPFDRKYSLGQTLQYRISRPLYHDEVGEVKLEKSRTEINAQLKEAYGSIRVTSEPKGASVILDNEIDSRGTTPLTIDKIASGQHQIRVQLPRYRQQVLDITVTDGATSNANANLTANFTTVTVNTLPEATIKADGNIKGTGSASWEQAAGVCDIEVSLKGHRSQTRQIQILPGEPQTLTLEPIPMYGILAIESEPSGAEIYIDGVKRGITPDVLEHVLAIEHSLKLSKTGFSDYTTDITIRENEETTVRGKLSSTKSVSSNTGQRAHNDSENLGTTFQSGLANEIVKDNDGNSANVIPYDFSYTISTVDMEPNKSPLVPQWWDMSQNGHYVGISYPTMDAKTAKLSALMNAIELFGIDMGMETKYSAYLNITDIGVANHSTQLIDPEVHGKYNQVYEASMKGFTLDILAEYYNHAGEYYVLCSINEDENSSNSFSIQWNYQDENKEGNLKSQVIFDISLNGDPIKSLSEYSCQWDKEKVHYSDIINDVSIWKSEYNLSDYPNSFLSKKALPLGFEQKQFLSSLPLIPDSLAVASRSYSKGTIEMVERNSRAYLKGYGKSQGRRIELFELKGNKNKGIIPMIKEVFPDEIPIPRKNFLYEKESEYSGLDEIYFAAYDEQTFQYIYDGAIWEQSKNNAFLKAIIDVNEMVKTEVRSQMTPETPESKRDDLYDAISSNTLRVFPLWYMDATLREIPKKKKNKDLESTLKFIDNSVTILIPKDN